MFVRARRTDERLLKSGKHPQAESRLEPKRKTVREGGLMTDIFQLLPEGREGAELLQEPIGQSSLQLSFR